MKGMLKPFKFQSKIVAGEKVEAVVPCANKVVHFQDLVSFEEGPISVLDNVDHSPTSTSTGGGGGGKSVKWESPENQEIVTGDEKSGEMEDWESVFEYPLMGDVEDPLMGLQKLVHGGGHGGCTVDGGGEVTAAFGGLDQGFLGYDNSNPDGHFGNFQKFVNDKIAGFQPAAPPLVSTAPPAGGFEESHCQYDVKPQLNKNANGTFFVPLENETLMQPQAKRYNSGSIGYNYQMLPKTPFLDASQNVKKMVGNNGNDHYYQGIIDQLYKAADMIQCGNNPILAQSILARLNHQLSPIGKPFERAAFYFKEALQLLIHSIVNNMNPISSPFSLILKIGAYKSFSEVSPFVQFTNFTCNQALLEALDGFDRVHIVDFDIGYGDQWASFMQELALRSNNNRIPSLKITAFASPTNDHLELSLTRENLVNFANEMNIGFDFEIVNIDVLASVTWSLPFRVSDNEAIAVNLPISSFTSYQIPFPLVLRFVKNLSPKIVVSKDRGCERTDLPFPNHIVHAIQSYTNLLESLDTVNMNLDTLQKIELFLVQPSVEKIINGRFSLLEKTQHWRSQFLSCGYTPLTFSNFAESQALCVIKRTPVRGFHVERRQSSLVLCWQHRELVSASAWRC
ncbi:GRAS protein [Artemisia annua]|uniref:GRAS protein n=1 Tax=Artemisia annua TaxID=35608 RepID=A0A2U1KZK5_ARTAN|nr:GRAS protein [Artemisia annua]